LRRKRQCHSWLSPFFPLLDSDWSRQRVRQLAQQRFDPDLVAEQVLAALDAARRL
jgi:hypothetical protein